MEHSFNVTYMEKNGMQTNENFPLWFGLDVSKDSFEAAGGSIIRTEGIWRPKSGSFSIDKEGVARFMEWAQGLAGSFEFGIAMEATGIYSQRLFRLIHSVSPSQHVAICNAASVSLYARSYTEEKNDRNDAVLITRYALDRDPASPRILSKTEVKLKEAVRTRNRLVECRTSLKNAQDTLDDNGTKKIQQQAISGIDKAIALLDKKIEKIVDSDETIKQEISRMTTLPGVGKLSATIIYAELGTMKNYTRKQISAMSGVCPVNKISGTSVHKHTISHRGSKLLRQILYLDSFQAIKKIPAVAELYKRMIGKAESSKMSARCACMRKILLILHAMVVTEKDYDPNFKSEKIVKNATKSA